ncbi:MAG: amino acid permease [Streptosporangiales bacterium]|nr:amino acid permease [Streptosporangiales bacterium]
MLPKRIALPVFASDPLSSVAYAPEEILLVMAFLGTAGYVYAPWIAACIVVVLLIVVASYRQNVRAYTSGGGDYEVTTVNHGPQAGLMVASALLIDYVLTVAVSVSAGVANLAAAVPILAHYMVFAALVIVAVLMIMNLRGVRESGITFAVPTYAFIVGVLGMIAYAGLRLLLGHEMRAPSADLEIAPEGGQLAGFAFAFLLLRAFSSGSAALTGVEAICNGVPAFRPPKGPNAAKTLLVLGLIAVTMFGGIVALSLVTQVRVTENPDTLVGAPPGYHQQTAITQVASAVFSNFPPGFYYLSLVTALILVLAANTAFNGFPVLGSILAQNRYLPRQLHTRGDRLAFSNGIVLLATFAGLLIYAFNAEVTRLIQLYIIGVFVSFTFSQTGMVRHWTRLLRSETDPRARRRMMRSRVINAVGGSVTGVVLVVVLITKFTHGAWIVVVAMPIVFLTMKGIRRHYDSVTRELTPTGEDVTLPARNHAIVLVSKIHKPALRALAYARATRPSTLEAVTVAVDAQEAQELEDEWESRDIPVTLKILDSPYREVTRPVLDYVRAVRRRSPRDVVTVFIPEYVVGHWWEHLLHNQSALRLKGRLLFQPGVMVTSVPWQLVSADRIRGRPERPGPGAARRPHD